MAKWAIDWNAMNPHDLASSWKIGVSAHLLKLLGDNGHDVKRARLLNLSDDWLLNPIYLIEGWDRPNQESCLVYIGLPKVDRRGIRISVPPPKNQMFLVFVLPDGTIDHWAWRPVNEHDPQHPDGIRGKILWPQQNKS